MFGVGARFSVLRGGPAEHDRRIYQGTAEVARFRAERGIAATGAHVRAKMDSHYPHLLAGAYLMLHLFTLIRGHLNAPIR